MKFIKVALIMSCSFLFAACAVGPNYVRPKAPVPEKFKEAKGKHVIDAKNGSWKVANPQDAFDRGRWWHIFEDDKLDELEARLNYANQNIINAYYNFQQSCALVAEAEASFLPTLTGSYSVTRQKSGVNVSGTGNITGVTGTTGTGSTTRSISTSTGQINTFHNYSLKASWELDVWGAVRRAVEASIAFAQSESALLSATRLSMQASLASYYFELRGLDADQRLLNDTVAGYRKTLQLTRNEYNAGTVARADVIQAQSQLESAESQAINVGILRAQYEHAIAMLIGVPPAALSIKPRNYALKPPPIPIMVPSALLERRPDIAQAERLMAQANAQIGVAVAAFFPTVNLTATASVTATGFIFSLPALAWAYGAQFTELILDGGLRRATVAAAKAGYHAKIASYRQTVLTAFQDVEDNLASLRILNEQIVVQRRATESARKALAIVINQYKAGTAPYLSVMVQQIATYTAEKAEIDINYQRMTAAVSLVRALGGGWDGVVCA